MFAIILVIMSAPANVDASAPMTLTPETSITFIGTTARNATASCERVRKALVASGKTAFCGDVAENK